MHHILTALVSVLGGGCILALVTSTMADVMQPENARNTWKNAMLTGAGVALAFSLVLAAQRLSQLHGLPFLLQTVVAALIVFGVLTAMVRRLYKLPLDEAATLAPVIGTSTAAICGLVVVALGA